MLKQVIFTIHLIFSMIPGYGLCVEKNSEDKLNLAIDAWLSNNDEVAIPSLANLANAGNESAMLLLSQIEKIPGRPSSFIASLNRNDRIKLFRVPGGISGTPWLKKVKKKKELAQAIMQKNMIHERFNGVRKLLELGETGEAIKGIIVLPYYGRYDEIVSLGTVENFPKELEFLLWESAVHELSKSKGDQYIYNKKLINKGKETLKSGKMQGFIFLYSIRGFLSDESPMRDVINIGELAYQGILSQSYYDFPESERKKYNEKISDLLLNTSEVTPLRNLCKEKCKKYEKKCLIFLFNAIGGYYGLMHIQSPLNSIVSRDKYFNSDRFQWELGAKTNSKAVDELKKELEINENCVLDIIR